MKVLDRASFQGRSSGAQMRGAMLSRVSLALNRETLIAEIGRD